ncbi:hypothetical protein BDA96_05G240100 [Sorghum bicolor]|uniref:CCHC-type domain-containing protein n=1 Tax=Sorghum bicolor TaxID=4558 RepID=A0A921UHC0_SORBI|nr:hypothetical protein BDA96_05G240100 [Sorghum bicolor]
MYLIVVDNILDEPECELLKCALIDNNYGSAVLMTSRKRGHIAYFVGSVHELQPLSDVDSRKLLYKRLFGSEDKRPSSELGEIYEKFLERCGGMPSTIITISRLLADKKSMTRDELYAFYASIYSGVLFDQTIGHDLPHLKTCLLYLSLFPKGCEVNGEHLIWKWLAEGFIHEKESEGRTSQELAELYLKELSKRDLIQPVDVDADGRVLYWTVKDHELIIAMSTQENFVSVLSSHVQGRPISSMVQRLSIQGSNVEHQQLEGHLSQVKSLVVSGDTNWIPSLSVLQDLRVLDLGGSQSLQNDDIKDIGSLFHLKCLIIGGKYITHIPEKIGDLLFLETLDLRESGVIELPERIFQIKQLKRLYINSCTNIPQGIGKLEALLELGDIKISEPNLLKELHSLKKLKILRIAIWSWKHEKLNIYYGQLWENLSSLVQARQNIRSLSILTCCSTDFMDTMAAEWAPSSLEKLEIRYGIFDKLPNWTGSLHVSSLSIEVNELSQDMINILGKLENLCSLSLTSKHEPKGKFVTDPEGFGKLESLQFVSNVMVKMFELKEEAMQKLRRLTLRFQASLTETENQDFSFGFESLQSLEQLHVEIICFNASQGVVNKAESAIQEAKARCPNNRLINLKIRRVRDQALSQKQTQEVKDQGKEEIMTTEAGKQTVEKGESSGNGQEKSVQVVCFNCGEIGHFSSVCSKPKVCFICHKADHVVDLCPEWQKTPKAAQYYGSANRGLGFYHIDVEPRDDNRFSHWLGMDNFGVFTIEEGEIDEEGILENLRELVDRDWAWQLRKIDEDSYIVRFPPHKKVENMVIGKASLFHVNKESVVASLKVWNGDVEPIGSLIDVWVQIKGIPPKWVDWGSIRKVASSLGLMVEVDWQSLFNSFFSLVRVKIQCKDPTKVPKERIFVLKKQLYLVSFKTEGFEQKDNSSDDGSGKSSGEEELEEEDPLDGDPKDNTNN